MSTEIANQWDPLRLGVCLWIMQTMVYGMGVLLLFTLWPSLAIFAIVIFSCVWSAIHNFQTMVELELGLDEVCSSTSTVLKSFARSLAMIAVLAVILFIPTCAFPVLSGLPLSDLSESPFMFFWLAPIGFLIGASGGPALADVVYVARKRH